MWFCLMGRPLILLDLTFKRILYPIRLHSRKWVFRVLECLQMRRISMWVQMEYLYLAMPQIVLIIKTCHLTFNNKDWFLVQTNQKHAK